MGEDVQARLSRAGLLFVLLGASVAAFARCGWPRSSGDLRGIVADSVT